VPKVDWRTVRDITNSLFEAKWPDFKCKPISKDRRGRCNPVVVWNFIAQLVREALERGVEDVESTLESLLDEVDPELSRGENYTKLSTALAALGKEKKPISEAEADYVAYIDMEITQIEEALESEEYNLTPEERKKLEEELERLKEERERLLGKAKKKAREEIPKKVEEKREEKPERAEEFKERLEKKVEALPEIPLEEVRHRIWSYIKTRVPRAYRADWRDLRARISYHREAEADLMRVVGELGGVVVSVVEARPPLKVMDVDFSRARVPEVPLTPEVEKALLWTEFSAILSIAGLKPEEYREVFEHIYSRLTAEKLPFDEKKKRIEDEARFIAGPHLAPPPPPPPPPAIPKEVLDKLESLERAVRELREAAAWRPKSSEELRMVIEATVLTEPRVMLRVDENGHPYIGPDEKSMTVIRAYLDRYAVKYFELCPVCRYTLPGGALGPRDFVEHLITKEAAVPPFLQDWLRRLAALIEEASRAPGV